MNPIVAAITLIVSSPQYDHAPQPIFLRAEPPAAVSKEYNQALCLLKTAIISEFQRSPQYQVIPLDTKYSAHEQRDNFVDLAITKD